MFEDPAVSESASDQAAGVCICTTEEAEECSRMQSPESLCHMTEFLPLEAEDTFSNHRDKRPPFSPPSEADCLLPALFRC